MPIYQPHEKNEVLSNAARNNRGPRRCRHPRLFERIID